MEFTKDQKSQVGKKSATITSSIDIRRLGYRSTRKADARLAIRKRLQFWLHDDELGWVFGVEHPCYSIRNREHSDGAEGRVPFSDWFDVIDQLVGQTESK